MYYSKYSSTNICIIGYMDSSSILLLDSSMYANRYPRLNQPLTKFFSNKSSKLQANKKSVLKFLK